MGTKGRRQWPEHTCRVTCKGSMKHGEKGKYLDLESSNVRDLLSVAKETLN